MDHTVHPNPDHRVEVLSAMGGQGVVKEGHQTACLPEYLIYTYTCATVEESQHFIRTKANRHWAKTASSHHATIGYFLAADRKWRDRVEARIIEANIKFYRYYSCECTLATTGCPDPGC